MKIKKFTKKGFTLIELLVVVLIIGILAAIAVPKYQIAVAKSRYSKLKHITRALVEAEEVYYLANNEYTVNMEDLDVEIPNGTLDTKDAENNEKHKYWYDWGYCTLHNSADDKRVFCVNTELSLGYREYFIYSPKNSGGRMCDLRNTTDETDWRAAICKAETNNGKYNTSTKYNLQTWDY